MFLPAQFLPRPEYFVDKVFQHWRRFDEPADSEHLEDGDGREEHAVDDVDGGHDGEQELELVDGAGDVAAEAEAVDLEQSLQVVEDHEANLQSSVVSEVVVAGLAVRCVPEVEFTDYIMTIKQPIFSEQAF